MQQGIRARQSAANSLLRASVGLQDLQRVLQDQLFGSAGYDRYGVDWEVAQQLRQEAHRQWCRAHERDSWTQKILGAPMLSFLALYVVRKIVLILYGVRKIGV